MSWIIAIIVGAVIGWLAGLIMKTEDRQGCILNIIIGIIGSALGKLIFGDLVGIGAAWRAGSFSFAGIIWGALGAIILIIILKALKVLK